MHDLPLDSQLHQRNVHTDAFATALSPLMLVFEYASARNTNCRAQPSLQEGMQTFQSVPTGPPPMRPTDKCQECTHWAGGWMWSLYVVTFTGIAAVSGLLAAFIVCVRPILKSIDEACKATEEAAGQLEVAAEELEQAAIMFEEDLPPTLKALEQASREFEDLGQSLNMLSSGFSLRRSTKRRRKRRPSQGENNGDVPADHQEDSEQASGGLMVPSTVGLESEGQAAMEAITKQTMGGISKVASDLNHMTRALVPAMDEWRIRLLNSLKGTDLKAQNGSAAPQASVAEADGLEGRQETSPGSRTVSPNWTSRWQGEPREHEDVAGAVGKDTVEGVLENSVESLPVATDGEPSMSTTAGSETSQRTTAETMSTDGDELQDRREVAMEVLDALLRAERAAQDAATASGDLQQAVRAAQEYGAFKDIDADFSGDSDALPTVMAASSIDQDFYDDEETPPLERGMDEDAVGNFEEAQPKAGQ